MVGGGVVGGAVGQPALVAPDALCEGAGVVVVVLERREDSAPCDLVGRAAIPVYKQGVPEPVAARIEPSVGQPCFFSCRVRDVCFFFFFLAPAEWGWLTRQRSFWTTGAGRLTEGEGGRGRRQTQLLSVDLVLVAEPVGSVAAAHSVVRVASQTCRRRIRRRRGRCQPARAAGWSGPGSPDEGTLGLVGGPVPCSRSRQSKGWGYGPDRPRLALLYPQAGLC